MINAKKTLLKQTESPTAQPKTTMKLLHPQRSPSVFTSTTALLQTLPKHMLS